MTPTFTQQRPLWSHVVFVIDQSISQTMSEKPKKYTISKNQSEFHVCGPTNCVNNE